MDFRSDILKKIIMFSEYTHECDTMKFKKDDYHYIKTVYGKKKINQTLDKRIHIINKFTGDSDSYPLNYDMPDINLIDCIIYGVNKNKIKEIKTDNCTVIKIPDKNQRKIKPYQEIEPIPMIKKVKNVISPSYDPENNIGYTATTPFPPNTCEDSNIKTIEIPLVNEIKNITIKIPNNKNSCSKIKKFFTNVAQNVKKFIKNF